MTASAPAADRSVLTSPAAIAARRRRIDEPHVRPLNDLVRACRRGRQERAIPWFDPTDGGVNARVLIVLEAPTPRAVRTGFVSMDNPDVASRNLRLLTAEAGLDRSDVVLWNLVPWCPPDGLGGAAFRAAHSDELLEGAAFLRLVLHTCPDVVWVVTLGKFARLGWRAGQPDDGIERPMRVVHAWNTRNRALASGNGRRREEVVGALREAGEWCGAGRELAGHW